MARSALGGGYTALSTQRRSPLSTGACRPVTLSTDPTVTGTTRVALRNVEGMRPGKARITLSRPGDLLGVVPYLVGFHPEESVVAVMLRSGRVVLTIRVDVPPTSGAAELAGRFVRRWSALVVIDVQQRLLPVGRPAVRSPFLSSRCPSGIRGVGCPA